MSVLDTSFDNWQKTTFHPYGDVCAVSVRALPDAHLEWSGSSSVNNKQASHRYKQLTTTDIAAEYVGQIKS